MRSNISPSVRRYFEKPKSRALSESKAEEACASGARGTEEAVAQSQSSQGQSQLCNSNSGSHLKRKALGTVLGGLPGPAGARLDALRVLHDCLNVNVAPTSVDETRQMRYAFGLDSDVEPRIVLGKNGELAVFEGRDQKGDWEGDEADERLAEAIKGSSPDLSSLIARMCPPLDDIKPSELEPVAPHLTSRVGYFYPTLYLTLYLWGRPRSATHRFATLTQVLLSTTSSSGDAAPMGDKNLQTTVKQIGYKNLISVFHELLLRRVRPGGSEGPFCMIALPENATLAKFDDCADRICDHSIISLNEESVPPAFTSVRTPLADRSQPVFSVPPNSPPECCSPALSPPPFIHPANFNVPLPTDAIRISHDGKFVNLEPEGDGAKTAFLRAFDIGRERRCTFAIDTSGKLTLFLDGKETFCYEGSQADAKLALAINGSFPYIASLIKRFDQEYTKPLGELDCVTKPRADGATVAFNPFRDGTDGKVEINLRDVKDDLTMLAALPHKYPNITSWLCRALTDLPSNQETRRFCMRSLAPHRNGPRFVVCDDPHCDHVTHHASDQGCSLAFEADALEGLCEEDVPRLFYGRGLGREDVVKLWTKVRIKTKGWTYYCAVMEMLMALNERDLLLENKYCTKLDNFIIMRAKQIFQKAQRDANYSDVEVDLQGVPDSNPRVAKVKLDPKVGKKWTTTEGEERLEELRGQVRKRCGQKDV